MRCFFKSSSTALQFAPPTGVLLFYRKAGPLASPGFTRDGGNTTLSSKSMLTVCLSVGSVTVNHLNSWYLKNCFKDQKRCFDSALRILFISAPYK